MSGKSFIAKSMAQVCFKDMPVTIIDPSQLGTFRELYGIYDPYSST